MGILLVRHAEAVQADSELDDGARYLSARGRADARACARQLAACGVSFDRFVTSPHVRAVQTAELFAEAVGYAGVVASLPALCFSASAKLAAEALSGLPGNVAAFGHMPTLSEILRLLLGGTPAGGFATAEAVWIDQGQVQFRVKAGG